MKVGAPPARGSMGIPPEMTEAFNRQREAVAKKREDSQPSAPTPIPDQGFEVSEDEPSRVDDADESAVFSDPQNPETLLKEIGVELTDDDLHRFVFKGYIEKEVKLSFFNGKKILTPTLKTLTANEYDAVGELLGSELNDSTIMREEVMTRRSMWTLALGVVKVDGRPLAKPVMMDVVKDGKTVQKVDLKATAKVHREVIGLLAAPVVSQLMIAHGKLSMALNMMTHNQGAEVLKK